MSNDSVYGGANTGRINHVGYEGAEVTAGNLKNEEKDVTQEPSRLYRPDAEKDISPETKKRIDDSLDRLFESIFGGSVSGGNPSTFHASDSSFATPRVRVITGADLKRMLEGSSSPQSLEDILREGNEAEDEPEGGSGIGFAGEISTSGLVKAGLVVAAGLATIFIVSNFLNRNDD